MTFFFGLGFLYGQSIDSVAVSCGCLALAMALGLAPEEAPPPGRPILISILALFSTLVPLGGLGILAIEAAFDASLILPIGDQWVGLDGVLPPAGVQIAASGLLLIAAYAFWKEQAWGRHLASGLVGLALLYRVISGGASMSWGFVTLLGLAAFLLWYFYGKRSVVSYYRHLEARRFEKASQSAGDPAA